MGTRTVLEVKNLCVDFATEKGIVRAVDGVSFTVNAGETLGIVGESGCGKTVTSLAVLGLIPSPPGRVVAGEILLNGENVVGISERRYRALRGKAASMIFQEPMTALNPVFTIGNQMVDVLRTHESLTRRQAKKRAIELLELVNIPLPERRFGEYPHQLSGGMRQRVMIAMALSCSPKLLIADEPTTALDVTTQAQVMEQMRELQERLGMAMILVTHDLGVVAEACQRVVVMYCGRVIENAAVAQLYHQPKHPYTRGLLESIPQIRDTPLKRLPTIEGAVPDLAKLPVGCRFADRCARVFAQCRRESPELEWRAERAVACFSPCEGDI